MKLSGQVTKIYSNEVVYYEPQSTTTLECHIDETIPYTVPYGVEPEWRVVEGNATSDYTRTSEPRSGNAIAVYTFYAAGTATVALQCRCASSLPPCSSSVKITLKGMYVK